MIEELSQFLNEWFASSELNLLHENYGGGRIFSDPKIGVARGDDPIFLKYKEVVHPEHLTPLEFWETEGKDKISAENLRVVSIIFPYVDKIRINSKDFAKSVRILLPAEIYSVGRNYANEFKKETCKQVIEFLKERGFNGIAGLISEFFNIIAKNGFYSNWSERHAAFAAGLGTFSLSEALITECGCNVRLGSVITDAPLEVTPRKSDDIHGNCLYYAKGTCRKCEENCPANAITENGHDKNKCWSYGRNVARKIIGKIGPILKPHFRRINGEWKKQDPPVGCAFCQFNVPCMDKNPMAKEQS